MSKDINFLHECIRPLAFEFEELLREREIPAKIFETRRTQKRQDQLVRQGVSKTRHSMHIYNIAFDVVFWIKKSWSWAENNDWQGIGQIGKDLGLYWGGDWKSFLDRPHFQFIPATKHDQAKVKRGLYPLPYPQTIKEGDQGELVKIMQYCITQKHGIKLVADGMFGGKSMQAVQEVQMQLGLTPDGLCRGGVWKGLI